MEESEPFQRLIDQHYAKIRRAALAMCGDGWEADEIAQETFLVALDRFASFRGDASEASWLYGICLRVHRSRMRTTVRQMKRAARWLGGRGADADEVLMIQQTPDSDAMCQEQADQLWRLVRRLPTAQRQVIVLRFVEAMSVTEIAKTLDCAEGTIKSRLHHATRKLKHWMEAKTESMSLPSLARDSLATDTQSIPPKQATPLSALQSDE